jgi:hypothetical protein
LSDGLSSRTIDGNIDGTLRNQNAYPAKGKPVSASDAPSSGERRPSSQRPGNRKDRAQENFYGRAAPDPSPRRKTEVTPEKMDAPSPRAQRHLRDHILCTHSLVPHQEEPPFHPRRGMVTIRPKVVDQRGDARLLCDGLHEGPHSWPEAYQAIEAGSFALGDDLHDDGIDQGDVLL